MQNSFELKYDGLFVDVIGSTAASKVSLTGSNLEEDCTTLDAGTDHWLDLQNHVTCPVCCEVYVTPQTLPCLHTLCAACVRRLCAASLWHTHRIQCPVCRRWTKVKRIRTDFRIQELADAYTNRQEAPPWGSALAATASRCETCLRCYTRTWYCQVCRQVLCVRCKHVHMRLSSTRSHAVTESSEYLDLLQEREYQLIKQAEAIKERYSTVAEADAIKESCSMVAQADAESKHITKYKVLCENLEERLSAVRAIECVNQPDRLCQALSQLEDYISKVQEEIREAESSSQADTNSSTPGSVSDSREDMVEMVDYTIPAGGDLSTDTIESSIPEPLTSDVEHVMTIVVALLLLLSCCEMFSSDSQSLLQALVLVATNVMALAV